MTCHVFVDEAPSTVDAVYVDVSSTVPLKPDEKIRDLYNLNKSRPYVLQRMTGRTYFFQRNYYATSFYVGDEGVLLFDPLEHHGEAILEAIGSVTDLPVKAVVYSHNHADHIADVGVILAKYPAVRLIASQATDDKMTYLRTKLPPPNEVIAWPRGRLRFEQLTVQLHGFPRAAHTDDHAGWLLVEERVLFAPDLLNPDQPPFWRFGGFENFVYFEGNLAALKDLDYLYVNGGHGNVGAKADFEFYERFLADLKDAVRRAMAEVPWGTGVAEPDTVNAHTPFLPAYLAAVAQRASDELEPRYGRYYGYRYATPDNALMIALAIFAYKL